MLSSRARTINGCRGGADYTHSSVSPVVYLHLSRGRDTGHAAAGAQPQPHQPPDTPGSGPPGPRRATAPQSGAERRPAARQPHVDAPCAAHSRAPQCRAEHCFPRSSFADGWRRVWLPVGDADPDAPDYALPSAQAPMSSERPATRHDVNSVPNRDGISLLRPLRFVIFIVHFVISLLRPLCFVISVWLPCVSSMRFVGIHSLRPLKVIQDVKGDLLVGRVLDQAGAAVVQQELQTNAPDHDPAVTARERQRPVR